MKVWKLTQDEAAKLVNEAELSRLTLLVSEIMMACEDCPNDDIHALSAVLGRLDSNLIKVDTFTTMADIEEVANWFKARDLQL